MREIKRMSLTLSMPRDNAWRYLIRHKVSELPINIFDLCRADNIIMLPYSTQTAKKVAEILGVRKLMKRTDGFTFQIRGTPFILWDDTKAVTRQRFTVAHELGHIMNGDTGPISMQRTLVPTKDDDPVELAANIFALHILAPPCVLRGMGVENNVDRNSDLCNISYKIAKRHSEWMSDWYPQEDQREMLKLEDQVYMQFQAFMRGDNIHQGKNKED